MCVRVCVVRVCLSEDAEQPLVHWVLNDIVVTLEEQPRFPPSLSVPEGAQGASSLHPHVMPRPGTEEPAGCSPGWVRQC